MGTKNTRMVTFNFAYLSPMFSLSLLSQIKWQNFANLFQRWLVQGHFNGQTIGWFGKSTDYHTKTKSEKSFITTKASKITATRTSRRRIGCGRRIKKELQRYCTHSLRNLLRYEIHAILIWNDSVYKKSCMHVCVTKCFHSDLVTKKNEICFELYRIFRFTFGF